MWIVRLALRRPYTFVVAALVVVLAGLLAIVSMPKDIFPDIDIPVVSVIWTYNGMSPDEMEKRVVTICERAFTGNVNDIEHIESQSMNGLAHIKVYFYPGAKIEAAVAQTSAIRRITPRACIVVPLLVPRDCSELLSFLRPSFAIRLRQSYGGQAQNR